MRTFAIVVIGYNRLSNIKRLIKSLEKVDYNGREDITLIMSIDKSDTDAVEKFATQYEWPYGNKIVRNFSTNQGLKKHVLSCGEYTQDFDILVVLEDDIYVSENLYLYSYKAALFYENDDNIAGISLYNLQKNWLNWNLRFEALKNDNDVYFIRLAQSWGQVWTKRKWDNFFEWYKKNEEFCYSDNLPEELNTWGEKSWLKYHTRYCIENNKFFVYPFNSISTNFSDPGTHNIKTVNDYQVELSTRKTFNFGSLENSCSVYDEFLNNIYLYDKFSISDAELTLDLWQTKTKKQISKKRYLLTTQSLNFEVIKAFSLALRPIELSILNNLEGTGIYLYDTHKSAKKIKKINNFELLKYSLRLDSGSGLVLYSIMTTINDLCLRIKNKIRSIKK